MNSVGENGCDKYHRLNPDILLPVVLVGADSPHEKVINRVLRYAHCAILYGGRFSSALVAGLGVARLAGPLVCRYLDTLSVSGRRRLFRAVAARSSRLFDLCLEVVA